MPSTIRVRVQRPTDPDGPIIAASDAGLFKLEQDTIDPVMQHMLLQMGDDAGADFDFEQDDDGEIRSTRRVYSAGEGGNA